MVTLKVNGDIELSVDEFIEYEQKISTPIKQKKVKKTVMTIKQSKYSDKFMQVALDMKSGKSSWLAWKTAIGYGSPSPKVKKAYYKFLREHKAEIAEQSAEANKGKYQADNEYMQRVNA